MGFYKAKTLGLALVASLVATGVAAPALGEVKIAVVDYGRLVEESPQAKAALDAIRNEFTPKEREVRNQEAALKAKEEKLTKDGATMTPDQRSRAEKDLRDGARELQRRRAEVQDDFNARRNEEMSRLQKTLIEEVRTYAKAQNFDIVIADGVIYSVPALDITAAILTSLQARAPKPTAGSAAPAGSAPKPPAK
jgi:outer membrane protein